MVTVSRRPFLFGSIFCVGLFVSQGSAWGQDLPDIKPPDLTQTPEQIDLKGKIHDVAVGGGGRFLILHFADQSELAVFDVNELKVVHRFPANDPNLKFAAGARKLILLEGTNQVIRRYDLLTRKEEAKADFRLGNLKAVAMGGASDGPLLVYYAKGNQDADKAAIAFVDPNRLKPFELEFIPKGLGNHPWLFNRDALQIRASAEGTLFSAWNIGLAPEGIRTWCSLGNLAYSHYRHEGRGQLLPSANGRRLYTSGNIVRWNAEDMSSFLPESGLRIPAVQGSLYLRLVPGKAKGSVDKVIVSAGESEQALATLEGVTFETDSPMGKADMLTPDKRIHFIPKANLLVLIPTSRDRLIVHRVDLERLLEKTDPNYLFVISESPGFFQTGKDFKYRVEAKSKGAVKFKFASAPQNAQITDTGEIRWKAPAAWEATTAAFAVEIEGAAERKIKHSIRLDRGEQLQPLGQGPRLVARVPLVGGAAVSVDQKTLIFSVPAKAQLLFVDSVLGEEIKTLELGFQPAHLALQGNRLFVAQKGAARVRVLDLETGKALQEFKLPGAPLLALACGPVDGLLYGTNEDDEVYSINPASGAAKKTGAKGQFLVVAPGKAQWVYTGVQKPIRDRLVIQEGPEKSIFVTFDKANTQALMLKFEVQADDLKLVAANDNAATNGKMLAVSGDGKRIAMAGLGGWRPKNDPRGNYGIAFFDTEDMKSLLGQVEVGTFQRVGFPAAVALHPTLYWGAAIRKGADFSELVLFRDKSLIKQVSFENLKDDGDTSPRLLFAGQGSRICLVTTVRSHAPQGGTELKDEIRLFPLPLSEEERAILSKTHKK